MSQLQIYDARERVLVGAADRVLAIAATLARPLRRRRKPEGPRRILLLRLERIGDLLMALPAIRDVRTHAPAAEIDLVVGSWNRSLAQAIPLVNRVETLDARWLSRDRNGGGMRALLASAAAWRTRRYDLAINFEPDVRSNVLLAASGAAWAAGWRSGGGGALLDSALEYDPGSHVSTNARRLVSAVFGRTVAESPVALLELPEDLRVAARARLSRASGAPLIGLHASGGRAVKQWEPEKFREVAQRLVQEYGAAIVLTGSAADRPLLDAIKAGLPPGNVVDVAGELDLPMLAAVLESLDLLVTGDTGPMHLAATVGTPVVAVFGPSDPVRYAPADPRHRVVRIDLPCSPCNRIRLPPARCTGHTPDCLAGIPVAAVFEAAAALLNDGRRRRTTSVGHVPA